MATKVKIFNDPVYGFISMPKPSLLLDVLDHPYFQRLRRISQTALTSYVYPGANHTRFHHALGAYHLMTQSIEVLRQKGVDITEVEAEGVCLAILMHDIGHGPFSHSLEHTIIPVHHERLSEAFMQALNEAFGGKLETAIAIFEDRYPKKFLHQLVSSQLDMDRMDYLSRDAFFTGVSEGVIGYDRILKMLNVVDNHLVVEKKGIYSIEKFLIARRLMYWQVYLHKTVLCAEKMLIALFKRVKYLHQNNTYVPTFGVLGEFLALPNDNKVDINKTLLNKFALLDDFDVMASLKMWRNHTDYTLAFLAGSLLDRRLFRVEMQATAFDPAYVANIKEKMRSMMAESVVDDLVLMGTEGNLTYNKTKEEIQILTKTGEIRGITELMDYEVLSQNIVKYYLCYPKF